MMKRLFNLWERLRLLCGCKPRFPIVPGGTYRVRNWAFGKNPFEPEFYERIFVRVLDVKDGWVEFEDCYDIWDRRIYRSRSVVRLHVFYECYGPQVDENTVSPS